jgi:aminomethyltransferase
MGEIEIRGPRALEFINYMTTNNAKKIEVYQAQYTAMCYEDGGIVDDLILYRLPNHYLLVVNASNIEKDYEWINENKIDGVEIRNISDSISQLAIQGIKAKDILQKLTKTDLSDIKFYSFREGELARTNMIISATGYTGEPGFELYFDKDYSEDVWNAVLNAGIEFNITPIGLAARDTLRLEKKYCLYGNDIDASTNPYEAGLGWITKLDKGNFIGRISLERIRREGIKRKLIGFELESRIIPRHGYTIRKDNIEVGKVTSGCFSPILEKNIGLGYVNVQYANISESIEIDFRGKTFPAIIVKTPFL